MKKRNTIKIKVAVAAIIFMNILTFAIAFIGYKLYRDSVMESYITYTDTDAGLFDLGIFSRQQDVTAFGTGIYTIDLSQITKNDIVVDKKEYTVTVTVPHPVLDTVAIDPEKTVIASQTSGFLSFGSIKLTEEQHKQIEMKCDEKLREKLNDETCMKQAEDYARMSCADLYQPLVSKVSPAYRVVIKVKEA